MTGGQALLACGRGDDPLDALIVRLAAAYEEPWLLKFHFDDVGSAAGRAAELADPGLRRAHWPPSSRSSSDERRVTKFY